jgi:hypothetical protein
MYFVTTKTTAGYMVRVLATTEKRDTARADAKRLDGTVRTQQDIDGLIAVERLDKTTLPGYVAPEVAPAPAPVAPVPVTPAEQPTKPTGRWSETAKNVAETVRKRTTLGKTVKVLKRPPTDDAVLSQAIAYVATLVDCSKVDIVRKLAAWESSTGAVLQRRDALLVLGERCPIGGLTIAPATVSTQWQLVRSGKFQAAQ